METKHMSNEYRFLRTGRVEYLDGSPTGVRRAKGMISAFVATAGPYSALDRVLATAHRPEFMTYILGGPCPTSVTDVPTAGSGTG